jgi:transcriptional regulator with XRE-family HTH domain
MTQVELALRCKKHPTYIWGVESGSRNPSLVSLTDIAQALEVPLSRLLADAEAAVDGGS